MCNKIFCKSFIYFFSKLRSGKSPKSCPYVFELKMAV